MIADSRMLEVLAKCWDESHAKDDWPSPPNPIRGYNPACQDPNIPLGIALWALRIIAKEAREAGIEEAAKECDIEAGYNDAVATDERDMLCVRAQAEQSASTKRHCAILIRALIPKDQT